MVNIGRFNKLQVIKEVSFGLYLDGGDSGEILLPMNNVPKGAKSGDFLNVFIHFDSEDRLIATTTRPKAQVGQCALLKVVDVNRVGAFVDWGLSKDLLVPRLEQYQPMMKNNLYIIYVKKDAEGRPLGSSKLDKFLDKTRANYKAGEEVRLLIAEKTPLGNKVIINHRHWGLLYSDEIFQTLRYGQKVTGYIKNIRKDGKIDVTLKQDGANHIERFAKTIINTLGKHGGYLALHDKSSSEQINRIFGESKSSFKKAIGLLYKQGKIHIESVGIRLREK